MEATERAKEIIAGWKATGRGVVDYADIEKTIAAAITAAAADMRERCAQAIPELVRREAEDDSIGWTDSIKRIQASLRALEVGKP